MSLRRSSRSAVAVLTALLLLLCQTAFAAQACGQTHGASKTPAAMPCHESAEHHSSQAPSGSDSTSVCAAGKAVGQATKSDLPAALDLPAVVITYVDTATYTGVSQAPQVVHAVCSSPPLTVLHCRFLN